MGEVICEACRVPDAYGISIEEAEQLTGTSTI